jgi:hypothetical protein
MLEARVLYAAALAAVGGGGGYSEFEAAGA